jgi:hypothetical protein
MYSSIEDSEVVLAFEYNSAGLKKLPILSEQKSDSSAFLNTTWHICTQLWIAFFICNMSIRISEGLLYLFKYTTRGNVSVESQVGISVSPVVVWTNWLHAELFSAL